jgi:transcription elongation GreA/GreB family factor
MNRDNLRARLEDIQRRPIERRIREYEELLKNVKVSDIERFERKQGGSTVVIEVRRRIDLLRRLCENMGMDEIANRAQNLLSVLE